MAEVPLSRDKVTSSHLLDLFDIVANAHGFDVGSHQRKAAAIFFRDHGVALLQGKGEFDYFQGERHFRVTARDGYIEVFGWSKGEPNVMERTKLADQRVAAYAARLPSSTRQKEVAYA